MSFERVNLATERLYLDPLTCDHTDKAHTLWTNADVRQFLWRNEIIDRKEAIRALQQSESDFDTHGFGLWGVHFKSHDDLIGFCGLRTAEQDGVPELLFGLLPAYWGLGIVTEASRSVVEHAFNVLKVDSIRGATLASNGASVKVLEHLGAEFLGREESPDGELMIYHLTPSRFLTLADAPGEE